MTRDRQTIDCGLSPIKKEGLPYQIYVSGIIRKFVNGTLMEKKNG